MLHHTVQTASESASEKMLSIKNECILLFAEIVLLLFLCPCNITFVVHSTIVDLPYLQYFEVCGIIYFNLLPCIK